MENTEASGSASTPPTRFEDEERELAATTDPKKRRQIQNRIAQRVYRQKQKKRLQELEQQAASRRDTAQSSPDAPSPAEPEHPANIADEHAEYASWSPLAMAYPFANAISQRVTHPLPNQSDPKPVDPTTLPKPLDPLKAGQKAIGFHSGAAYNVPSDLQFIAVGSVSVNTAVTTNLAILGITPEQYALDDATSPFSEGGAANISMIRQRAPDFAPTQLQLEIEHHPYIDIIPFRGLRDNLLMALDSDALDEAELCGDIERYLRIWGRLVWDVKSYEWAPEFFEKWMWLLDDEAVNVSNFWRAQRGETPLEMEKKGKGYASDDMDE